MATITDAQREAVKLLLSRNTPQRVIADSLGISRRQVIKVAHGGKTPEKLAKEREATETGLSASARRVRQSFRKNAARMGKSTTIRGNSEYKEFKKGIDKQDRIYERLKRSMGGTITKEQKRKYKETRIEWYYKMGLITDEERERYLQT